MKVLVYQPEVGISAEGEEWANKEQVELVEKLVEKLKPDLVVLPELWPGYPWAMKRLSRLPCYSMAGTKTEKDGKKYNSYVLTKNGKRLDRYDKIHLYKSENEEFIPGEKPGILRFGGLNVGILICNDVTSEELIKEVAEKSDLVVMASNADVRYLDKEWKNIISKTNREYGVPVIFANVGGVYEWKGDRYGGGESMIFDEGEVKIMLGKEEGWVLYDTQNHTVVAISKK
ncbi:MAG: hypothetical protein DRP08_01925 [Candidatus Aenigmatarchaeota archaeon]|nr:MAG: hypothetical protein DRP08_01925 [Candidatus Aenigmarchaeota archaeon]